MDGPLTDAMGLRAIVRLDPLLVLVPEYPGRSRVPVVLRLESGVLTVDELQLFAEGTDLAVSGQADLLGDGPLDLRIEGERIAERGRDLGGGEAADLSGCLVLPGLVNAHTHLYSALARGMPWPSPPPRNFIEILEKVWWKLDRALDEEAVYHSAMAGAMEAALSGTTLLIDHHSSPSFIAGSLDTIRRAVEAVGLRSVLCYEVTDRNGVAGRDAGLAENRRFLGALGGVLARTRA